MNIRLLIFLVVVLAMGCGRKGNENRSNKQRANIIFLLADDQNTLSLGCYGNKEVQTPNIDKLGEEGLIFDRHYNTTAICMASRASILTGMYEYKTGTNFTHGDMKPEVWEKSYPILLQEAGYLTAFAGKFGLEVEGKGICEDDFDFWGGGPGQTYYETAKNKSMAKYAREYPHATLSYGAFSQDVIKEAVNQDKPFCLSISFKAPHKPAKPDPKFDNVYKDKTFTKPLNFGREKGEHLSLHSKQGRQYARFYDWNYATNYDEEMRKYYQQIYAIDVALGMIRSELEKQGIAENTVIIYTSDNGFISGSHGYGSKVLPMEESSRVPLIVFDPRSKSEETKHRTGALTANIDFAPTILDLANDPIPENMDGISLLPLLEKPEEDLREQIAFINVFGSSPATHSLSCITKELKYTFWWYSDDTMKPTEELFNLKEDPYELKNYATLSDTQTVANLEKMRSNYDKELDKWKENAVPYNQYQCYGVLFDRVLPYSEKLSAIDKVPLYKGNKK